MNSFSSKKLLKSELDYRDGNFHYSRGDLIAAEISWKNSSLKLYPQNEIDSKKCTVKRPPYLKIIGAVLLTALCFYTIIFSLFPRKPDSFSEWMLSQQQNQNQSFWVQWWDTGRPSISFNRTSFGSEDWLQQFRDNLKDLMDQEDKRQSGSRIEFKKWLDQQKKHTLKEKPKNNYVLIGRGLFNVRKFEDAISTYHEGLHITKNPLHMGELFRELGTAYYYKGYQLQPDGLAKYDLKLVQNSVDSYLQAEKYASGPYLYGNMGWGFYLLNRFKKSIEYSERALILDPSLVYVRMNLGISYLRMHEYSKAFLAYQGIKPFEPENEEYDGGMRDLKELKLQHPSRYPFSDFILGFILMEQGRFQNSRESLFSFLHSNFSENSWKLKAKEMIRLMDKG